MTQNVHDLIAYADKLSRQKKRDEALVLANQLVEQYSHEMKVWDLRAHLYTIKNEYKLALADYTKAISIYPEHGLYFARGIANFEVGDNRAAVEDFTNALVYYKSDDESYRWYLYFWRAETLLRMGRKEEALSDLEHVRDGFDTWTYKLRSKEDLIADCKK